MIYAKSISNQSKLCSKRCAEEFCEVCESSPTCGTLASHRSMYKLNPQVQA